MGAHCKTDSREKDQVITMGAIKRTVWQVAADLRQILDGMDLKRYYPDVRMACFVGLRSVQLEVRAPIARQRRQVADGVIRRLTERYADWEDFYAVRFEEDYALLTIGGEHLVETL